MVENANFKDKIMIKYQGMKWLKCDLHMHSPLDSINWRDTLLTDKNENVASFAKACLNTGLDIIAITDHNFISKDFVFDLQREFRRLHENGEKHIIAFPGFEFEANVGRGVHVIALFPFNSTVEKIEAALTECGVGIPRIENGIFKKSTKSLSEILGIIQNKHKGIVILPHCQSDEGIFDNDNISEWLQQDQYCDDNLLAVEVSKPISQMSSGFQKLFRSGNDCIPGWKRIRPIATLMSSDCKQLQKFDQNSQPVANSIGYRFSWIKMSEPSIESLRQAFLDHSSRIMLPSNANDEISPARKNPITRIKSIIIKKAEFLEDQEIYFSPNLNTLIGGRGCGKSTILEYLRVLLHKNKNVDQQTEKKISRIQNTISPETVISVTIENADGVGDTITLNSDGIHVQDRKLTDEETFFEQLPISFFSQQQITHLTNFDNQNTKQLLDILDGFVVDKLSSLNRDEELCIRRVNDAYIQQDKIKNIKNDKKKLEQELIELERQWKAHHEIENEAKTHKILSTEKRLWRTICETVRLTENTYSNAIEETSKEFLEFTTENLPHRENLEEAKKKIVDGIKKLNESVQNALTDFIQEFQNIQNGFDNSIAKDWENADNVFLDACKKLGLSPEAVGHLRNINASIESKKHEIDSCKKNIEQLLATAESPQNSLESLYSTWREQYNIRLGAASKANLLAKLEGNETPFIDISIRFSADYASFAFHWKNFSPHDRRTRLGREWEDIGKKLYEEFLNTPLANSPWELIQRDSRNKLSEISNIIKCDSKELCDHIINNIERWRTLLTSRVQDAIDITLYRPDGSIAGKFSNGSLSDGQKNTAVLVLLLAQAGGPLVIDQPEDELDSNFVYRELIPMLRRVKNSRQIIVATHNANLPVNGDAELVYALEARDGHGCVLGQGGLDKSEVTNAILDIMEGSEEAFRKRREKYNF